MSNSDIKVQLVHLNGPLKGELQEFVSPVICIGRHPECQVVFPKDCTTLSRRHVEIRREGNRYKCIDLSTNGTLINGKKLKEAFLKDGDVLILGGKDGPKVSFLTARVAAGDVFPDPVKLNEPVQERVSASPSQSAAVVEESSRKDPAPLTPAKAAVPHADPPKQAPSIIPEPKSASVQPAPQIDRTPPPAEPEISVPMNYIIQHGASINSFNSLPVTIGSSDECDCVIRHPALLPCHARIFFKENQYWIKDLTGRGLLTVNLQPVQSEAPLLPDTCLALTPTGPKFQFLGEGRLAEIDTAGEKQPQSSADRKKRSKKKGSPDADASASGTGRILIWIVLIILGLGAAGAFWLYYAPSSFPVVFGNTPHQAVQQPEGETR